MQGFELRLGKSAVGETRTDFSVQELEHQLEEALLAKYPMASQLVIQPKDCTLGKAWLVQSGGVVSTPGEVFWIALQDRNYTVKSLIKLSVGQCNGQRWGFSRDPLHLSLLWPSTLILEYSLTEDEARKCFTTLQAAAKQYQKRQANRFGLL
jgi:hypothetical protein